MEVLNRVYNESINTFRLKAHDHTILLDRLDRTLGVGGAALNWFRQYHIGREQVVIIIGSSASDPITLGFGAPQGSVMGSEDYKIYTLPVGQITRKHGLSFHGYADDSNNYTSFSLTGTDSYDNAIRKIANATADIKRWMTQNLLKLNDTKTEVLVIVPPAHKDNYGQDSVPIADAMIQPSESAKGLGFWFDRHLSLDIEIQNRCRVMLFHLRNIRSIRPYITQSACEKLVHALISSRLDYANALLAGLPKKKLNLLQRIQNMAARVVTNSRKSDHISPILYSLHWLPVKSRIDYKILTLTFKILHGTAPDYLCKLIERKVNSRNLRSSSKALLVIPKVRTKQYGERAFSFVAPKLWNDLPNSIQSEENYNRFKKKVKTHLGSNLRRINCRNTACFISNVLVLYQHIITYFNTIMVYKLFLRICNVCIY